MEIGGFSPNAGAYAEGLSARAGTPARVSAPANPPVAREPGNVATPSPGQPRGEEARANQEKPRAEKEVKKAAEAPANFNPSIQFRDQEGTRVMEVFDSKEVLIYQVPPKGYLTLITSQDKQAESQVNTEA